MRLWRRWLKTVRWPFNPAESVKADIDRLRNNPGAPGQMVVSGFVYDASNGKMTLVVPPAPLRTTA